MVAAILARTGRWEALEELESPQSRREDQLMGDTSSRIHVVPAVSIVFMHDLSSLLDSSVVS